MPIDARIPLGVQSPEMQSPLEAYGKAMSLRNMMQQGQMQQQQMQMQSQAMQENDLKLQQLKQTFADEQTARQILSESNGNLETAQPLLLRALGSRAIPVVKTIIEGQKAIAELDEKRAEKLRNNLKVFDDSIDNIMTLPPERRNLAYQNRIGMLMKSGLIDQNTASHLPFKWDDELMSGYGNHLKQTMAQLEIQIKQGTLNKTGLETQKIQQEVSGTQPISPFQTKQLEQQAKPNTAAELAVIASDPTKPEADRKVAKDALKILERHAVASRPQIDLGQTAPTEVDPNSQSILAQTGLSQGAFMALTGQMGSLPRDARTRAAAMKEAREWAVKHNVDTSTIASQFKANNEVLAKNISRAANTKIMEDEMQGTIENLQGVVNSKDLSRLRWANVVKVWANQQVNDPLAQQYAMHLYQLRQELAAYGAATQGRSGNEINLSDWKEAEDTIKNGIDSGSLNGLSTAVKNSTDKMGKVMQRSVVAARRAIWNLFGVGQNFKEPNQGGTVKLQAPDGSTKEVPADQADHYIQLGAKRIS